MPAVVEQARSNFRQLFSKPFPLWPSARWPSARTLRFPFYRFTAAPVARSRFARALYHPAADRDPRRHPVPRAAPVGDVSGGNVSALLTDKS